MSIFFRTMNEAFEDGSLKSGLAVYCTICRTHYTVSPRESIVEDFHRKEYLNYNPYESILWDDKKETTRCLNCGHKHQIANPRMNPIITIFHDEDKVKLSMINIDTIIVYQKRLKRNVLIEIRKNSRLVFNTKTRRVFMITKPKNKVFLKDISYSPEDTGKEFSWVSDDKLIQLREALGLDCANDLISIIKAFKFGDADKGTELLKVKYLFNKDKKFLVSPVEEAMKKFKFQLASKGVKRLVGEDKLRLILWHLVGRHLLIDNALKLIPVLATVYLANCKYVPQKFKMEILLDLIVKAPNETDIIRKLIKFFNASLNVKDDGDIFDQTNFQYKDVFKFLSDILANINSIEDGHDLSESFNNTTIRQYVYKGDMMQIHEQSSLAQNILKEEHLDLPNNASLWNKTVNGISFICPKNEIELCAVGIYLHICVGGYGDAIISGRTYVVYAVDKSGLPIACIEVNWDKNLNLRIEQLKAYTNKKVTNFRQECLAYLKSIECNSYYAEDRYHSDVDYEELDLINLNDFKIIRGATTPLEIPTFVKKELIEA